ncbi:MAG: alpha/beta hydrolase, partial [Peptococcaceae bacterium]|nr:alpha/beta hydrolase [Peptococcaceae bacterium]
VNAEQIYIAGHSLGGYLMPRIAAQTPDAAGYIMLAAAARPLEDLILEQTEYILSLEKGLDDASKEKLLKQTQDMVTAIKALTPDDSYAAEQLGGTPASYWLDLQNYDPITEVQNSNKPFLVLQGGRDYQVTKTDYDLWQSAFDQYSDVHFRFYDNLNHLFMSGTGKSIPDEYQQKNTVDTVVGNDIASFVLDHAAIEKQ